MLSRTSIGSGRPAPELAAPRDLAGALAALHEPGAEPLAGGTWVMRAPVRGEPWARTYVALGALSELQTLRVDHEVTIGAGVTHATLACATAARPALRALHVAAGRAANPAVRRVATVGGNLCTAAFPAADLAPALLCLEAEVMLAEPAGARSLALDRFLQGRDQRDGPVLLREVRLRPTDAISGHARLPLRLGGGDYPAAIVSLAVVVGPDNEIERARVAVGSVEPVARRWPALEAALVGLPAEPARAAGAARQTLDVWSGRDGVDAPGWYRVRVLPALVARALQDALTQGGGS